MQTLKNNNARLTAALQDSAANVEEWKTQVCAVAVAVAVVSWPAVCGMARCRGCCVCRCPVSHAQLATWKDECARLKKRATEAEAASRDAAEREASTRAAALVSVVGVYRTNMNLCCSFANICRILPQSRASAKG